MERFVHQTGEYRESNSDGIINTTMECESECQKKFMIAFLVLLDVPLHEDPGCHDCQQTDLQRSRPEWMSWEEKNVQME
jgi:hypothetical protein